MRTHRLTIIGCFVPLLFLVLCSCRVIDEYSQKPELESLRQGLKTSTAVGYCVSVVNSAYRGATLPDNIVYNRNLGLIYMKIDALHPLPFNKNIGDIIIVFQKNIDGSGIMAISFANIDILGGSIKLYGLNIVPFIERAAEKDIVALYAKQDIIIGSGSDTILDLNRFSYYLINSKIKTLDNKEPSDLFVAVKQNIWFVRVDQSQTYSDFYDDKIVINGGGQILEAKGSSGGIVYHALINAEVNYSICKNNPISGNALSQNFKAGDNFIDLGNSLLDFHENCDGNAFVAFSTGKYVAYNRKNIALGL